METLSEILVADLNFLGPMGDCIALAIHVLSVCLLKLDQDQIEASSVCRYFQLLLAIPPYLNLNFQILISIGHSSNTQSNDDLIDFLCRDYKEKCVQFMYVCNHSF